MFEKIDILKGCPGIVADRAELESSDEGAKPSSEELVAINEKLVGKIAGTDFFELIISPLNCLVLILPLRFSPHLDNAIASNDFEYYTKLFIQFLQRPNGHASDLQLLVLLVVQALLSRLTGAHQTDFAHDALRAILGSNTHSLENMAAASGEHPENTKQVRSRTYS